jgi:serine protease Do
MARQRPHRIWVPALAGALVLASCGGGSDDSGSTAESAAASASEDTAAPATDAPPDTAPADTAPADTAEAPSGDISSIEDIRPAVVQILAQGSFRDPLEGQQSGGWTGSGFIVSPDGIIVTNNHVVTGAGAVEVVLEDGEEVPARVLGVSECNDLAVLQLIDPGPYPYLDWHTGDVTPPLEVYTAGFPLGDPEYTVTRGIVSKAETDGETQWASVRQVIEHDAAIQPGNSGGPLVGADGKVVAVNYAAYDPGTGTVQYRAIAGDLAVPVIEELQSGDSETIGVNGEAVVSDDGSFVGVWVAAVEAGTPAANAGVLPGDIITTLNGVEMSPGTMEAYCDVLRSAVPDEPIAIQVIRFDTEEVWAGELNGTPMTVRRSFATELEGEVEEVDDSAPAYEYEEVIDDTGTLTVSVPTVWAQRDTTPTTLESGEVIPSIAAAPDLEGFYNSYDQPGMLMFGLTSGATATTDVALDEVAPDVADCTSNGREPYEDPVFVGQVEYWTCGQALYITLAANPASQPDALVVIGVSAITEADLEALDNITNTFNFL